MKKNWIIRVLAVAVVLLRCSASALAAPAADQPLTRMGWQMLTPEQQYVYERLEEGVSVLAEEIELDRDKKITDQDISFVSQAFCSDYPEYFWYLGDYEFIYTNQGEVTKLMPKYTLNGKQIKAGQEIEDAKAALKSKADAILANVPDGVYQSKEQYLHDALAEAVSYEKSGNDQTAYGALVDGKAVCAGYTRAYQYLLNLIGISSWKIDGTAVNPQGQVEEHSWNLVMVPDFGCTYTDVTWDDQGENLYHAYYNRSLKEISEDHTTAQWQLPLLPECNHEARDYFHYHEEERGGACILEDKMTGKDLAYYFKAPNENGQGSASRVCNVWYMGNDFKTWVNANAQMLAQELGFVGAYQCGYTNLGREYCLSVTGEIDQQTPTEATEPTVAPGAQLEPLDTSIVIWLAAGAAAVVLIVIIALIISSRRKKK